MPDTKTFKTKNEQLTVQELIDILNAIVRKDPSIRSAPVYHIEFGSMTSSKMVELTRDGSIVIAEHE